MQTLRLGDRYRSAQSGQPVVAPPLIVMFRVRPFGQLFDQALLEQPSDRGVQAAWTQPKRTIGALEHVLHDGVAVPIAIGERYEDVERVAVQRQEGFRTLAWWFATGEWAWLAQL